MIIDSVQHLMMCCLNEVAVKECFHSKSAACQRLASARISRQLIYLLLMTGVRNDVSTPAHSMRAMASIMHGLRFAAPRITRRFFTCQRCRYAILRYPIAQNMLPKPFSISYKPHALRTISTSVDGVTPTLGNASPLSALGIRIDRRGTKRKFFPVISDKVVAYWLLGSAASVFGIVVFGGLTRLTESG